MMKKFLLKTTFLFIVPICILLFVSEYYLRKIPNDYQYKNEWLSKYGKDIKIINFGSSHTYNGIKPKYFTHKSFNAAHPSQSIKYDHFIFNKFIDDLDSLKVAILPLSYFSITYELENSIEDWRIKDYSIYYNCKIHKSELKYNFEIYHIHYQQVLSSMLGTSNRMGCDDLGSAITNKLSNRSKQWKSTGETAAKRHTSKIIDSSIVYNNKKLLTDIITSCKYRNVSVILLTTPTFETYRNYLNENQLNLMLECGRFFENTYSNVHYLNLLDDSRFDEHDFLDADHLNEFGAEKLTTLLDHYIDSLQLIK